MSSLAYKTQPVGVKHPMLGPGAASMGDNGLLLSGFSIQAGGQRGRRHVSRRGGERRKPA